jgi:ABC-2 type transport system permease protein
MRTTGTLIRNELLRMLRTRETFWMLIVLPLVLIFILGNALSGFFNYEDRLIDPVEVGLVVPDESAEFVEPLRSEAIAEWLTVRDYADRERMLKALRDGDIGYGVVVPEHFAEMVMSGREAHWELYPGQKAERNLVAESVIGGLLDRINLAQSAAASFGDPKAAEAAVRAAAGGADGSHVTVTLPDMTGRDYSAMQYYAAQMLVMFLLYTGMAAGLSIVEEREMRTMDRILAAPVKPVHVLAGKIAGSGLIGFGQAVVIIVFTRLFYGLEWGDRYGSLLAASLFVVVASIGLAVIVAALAPKARALQMIFMTLIMGMTFLSGGFTPELGEPLERLGEFTLSYWASQSYIHLMLGSADAIVREHLTVLGASAAGLFLLATLLGGKAVSHE